MVNSVTICGRLVRDPELRRTSTGKAVTTFSIAFTDRTKDSNGNYTSSFVNCTAWNATAEYVANYLKKGTLVCVQGRLQERRYTRNDGTNARVIEIVVENIDSLSGSRNNSAAEDTSSSYEDTSSSNDDVLGTDIADDDLPF